MRSLILLELLAFVAAAPSDPSPIRLPDVARTIPQPMTADAAVTLTTDVLYVVRSDVPCLAFLSPGGAIKFTKETGPIKVRGKFADGSGTETRTFTEKHVYLFEAVKEGRDELIIVPVGAVNETDARRVTFVVGQGPRPPPDDDKKDETKPVTSFRVFLIYESGATYPQAAINVLYGGQVEEWLTANCTGGKSGWRRRDRSLGGENDPTFAAMWAAIQPKLTTHPCIAIEVNGKVEIIPLEPTQAAMVEKLKTYRGAK